MDKLTPSKTTFTFKKIERESKYSRYTIYIAPEVTQPFMTGHTTLYNEKYTRKLPKNKA